MELSRRFFLLGSTVALVAARAKVAGPSRIVEVPLSTFPGEVRKLRDFVVSIPDMGISHQITLRRNNGNPFWIERIPSGMFMRCVLRPDAPLEFPPDHTLVVDIDPFPNGAFISLIGDVSKDFYSQNMQWRDGKITISEPSWLDVKVAKKRELK